MEKKIISVIWDDNDFESIRKAEKKKTKYENKGYGIFKTIQRGFDKWELKMKKVI